MKIILGLGSNVGDKKFFLNQAIRLLQSKQIISNIELSSIYESEALLPDGAPQDWNMSFYNMAVMGDCELSPKQVLTEIKSIEQEIGRINRGFWSPREIDIDILLFGDLNIVSEDLTIPHKFLLERDFALLPVNDLKPDWVYPREGLFFNQKISDIIARNLVKANCQAIDQEEVA